MKSIDCFSYIYGSGSQHDDNQYIDFLAKCFSDYAQGIYTTSDNQNPRIRERYFAPIGIGDTEKDPHWQSTYSALETGLKYSPSKIVRDLGRDERAIELLALSLRMYGFECLSSLWDRPLESFERHERDYPVTFQAKPRDGDGSHTRVELKIAECMMGADGMPSGSDALLWNPLGLQPHLTIMVPPTAPSQPGDLAGVKLEITPLIFTTRLSFYGNISTIPDTFQRFLNEQVLAGTMYRVIDRKIREAEWALTIKNGRQLTPTDWTLTRDWDHGILFDGTPVFLGTYPMAPVEDMGPLITQKDRELQQRVLGIIHQNCEKLGLPEPLRWAVPQGDGTFLPKQAVVHPSPYPTRGKVNRNEFKILPRPE